jgi:putative flippase GtrA
MTDRLPRIVTAVQGRLRSTVGKRFSRFAVAAAAALVASQTTLAICLGPVRWTAGRSALAAWVAGAGTSYLVSRWAWERKGRPHLLKETLPFWVVAVCAAIVLTSTTKFANSRAIAMGFDHTQQVIIACAAFFVANCVTFITRFLIFHYILFADRGSRTVLSGAVGAGPADAGRLPVGSGSPTQLNGSPTEAATAAGLSHRRGAARESGTRPEPDNAPDQGIRH